MWRTGTVIVIRIWRWLLRHPWLAFAIIMAGIAANVFIELIHDLFADELISYDLAIHAMIAPYQTASLTALATFISDLLSLPCVLIFSLPILVFLMATQRYWIAALLVIIPTLTSYLVDILKGFFSRERPLTALIAETGHSFPSGHATGAVVVYGLLAYLICRYLTRARWARSLVVLAAALLILLTGLARIYLQVHYASDVLAGWATGTLILLGAITLMEACRRKTDTMPHPADG